MNVVRVVVISNGAERDLESLHAFVANSRSVTEANEIIDRIVSRSRSLATFSERGSVPRELQDLGIADYRQIVVGIYRVFYFVDGDTVVIDLIADGRRDMRALLQQRLLNP